MFPDSGCRERIYPFLWHDALVLKLPSLAKEGNSKRQMKTMGMHSGGFQTQSTKKYNNP